MISLYNINENTSMEITKDDILFLDCNSFKELCEKVSDNLKKRNLVKDGYLENVLIRESKFPTGLDLEPINPKYGNIAIPHTDIEYCNGKKIIYVANKVFLKMNNMISPEDVLEVNIFFFLINNTHENQINLLTDLMELINESDQEDVERLLSSKDKGEIEKVLNSKFN